MSRRPSRYQELSIELERDTPDERDARIAAIKKTKASQRQFAERAKDGPISQVDDVAFLKSYMDSELTEDLLNQLALNHPTMVGSLLDHPRCFPHAAEGWELHALKQQQHVFTMENPEKSTVPLEHLPKALRDALQDDRNRLLRALTELTKYMQRRLGDVTQDMGNVVTSMQMDLLEMESEIYLRASFGLLPVQNRFMRPMSIALEKPLFTSESVSILFFVANKERKHSFRKSIAKEPWAPNVELLRMEKFLSVYKTKESQVALLSSYDMIFADKDVEMELYTHGSVFDSPYYKKAPVVINDETRVCDIVNGFINGTKLFISRGMQPVSIHVGYAQWKPEEIKANVISVVQQLGYYIEGGYNNILRLYVSGENAPSLPFYYNKKAYMQRFKECKKFTKEKEWAQSKSRSRVVSSDGEEDEEEMVRSGEGSAMMAKRKRRQTTDSDEGEESSDDDDDEGNMNYLYAKYGAQDGAEHDSEAKEDKAATSMKMVTTPKKKGKRRRSLSKKQKTRASPRPSNK